MSEKKVLRAHEELLVLLEKRPKRRAFIKGAKGESCYLDDDVDDYFDIFVPKFEAFLQRSAEREAELDKLTQDLQIRLRRYEPSHGIVKRSGQIELEKVLERLCALKKGDVEK